MVIVMVAISVSIGCFLDLVSLYKNFDNDKFRKNLIMQALIKMAVATLLTTHLYLTR